MAKFYDFGFRVIFEWKSIQVDRYLPKLRWTVFSAGASKYLSKVFSMRKIYANLGKCYATSWIACLTFVLTISDITIQIKICEYRKSFGTAATIPRLVQARLSHLKDNIRSLNVICSNLGIAASSKFFPWIK